MTSLTWPTAQFSSPVRDRPAGHAHTVIVESGRRGEHADDTHDRETDRDQRAR